MFLEDILFAVWLRRATALSLGVLLFVGSQSVPAGADTNVSMPLQVNFGADTTAPISGYTLDYGLPYDANRGYGWTDSAGVATSLVGNGRDRGVAPDKRLDTLMQMQLKAGSVGVSTPGAWKAAIANGTYQVTIAAGDPSYTDSTHVIRVEGTTVVNFTPTSTTTNATSSATVTVADGFLNVDAIGGTNTKINYLTAVPVDPDAPVITAVTPANGATGVTTATAVTVQLSAGIDPTTATAANFKLLDSASNPVAGNYNTDGAYSNATFQPSLALTKNAVYTVQTTTGLKDPAGNAYPAFTSTFTTGEGGVETSGGEFTKSVFDVQDAPTALALGPDSKLYAAFANGGILAYSLDADGKKTGTPTAINNFKNSRIISALKFDPSSTANNLTLWVSNGQGGCDLAAIGIACNDFTGMISKLTGTSASTLTRTDVITGLPRSVGNHMNNGIDFGPDGAMYLAQGANNGYGAPDAIWGNRAEVALAAAILRIDLSGITTPYNVATPAYDYNAAGAKVKLYATGTRNPYSVLWHSNGKLYAPVNESASGNTPADPNNGAPARNDLPAYNDYFTQIVQGKYYGHPNPARNEYRLNGGNPTANPDPFEVSEYPVGTQPNSNWRKPDLNLGVHRSANGSTEFKSNVFGGTLKGEILVTEYAGGKDIIAIKLDSSGNVVGTPKQVMSGFNNPLPIVSDPVSGRVYVGEYGRDPDGANGQIDLLTPKVSTTNPPPGTGTFKINFQDQASTAPAGYTADYGQAFDTTRGFGWQNQNTGAPLSLVGNGRARNVLADKRLDTLMQMQLKAGSAGVTTPGKWELVVPNGMYDVTIGVGDGSYIDSRHLVNAEGQKIVDFTPATGNNNTTVTAAVSVTDGRLTIDAIGGTNTKVNYIDVAPQTTTPPPASSQIARVNFEPQTSTTPTGYVKDYGLAYNSTTKFGWETLAGAPLSLVGNARERNVAADKRLDTFVHMNYSGEIGVTTVGRWRYDLPNGQYNVTVGVGDPSYTDSTHVIRAENTVIGSYTPTAAVPNKVFTATVTVADGNLTLDQTGGSNTKINFVDIDTANGNPPPADITPPSVTVVPSGTTNASGQFIGQATVTINATDTGSGVKNTTYTLDGGPAQAYSAPFNVGTTGTHTVVATSTDNANNTSAQVTSTFTVVAASPATLEVISPQDYLGLGSRMIFSTVNYTTQPTQNLTLRNTSTTTPLQVTGLTISGTNPNAFKLVAGQATNFSIPANSTRTVGVQFTPTVVESNQAQLAIATNQAGSPPAIVTLGGMNARNFEDVQEPSLQAIFNTFGYNINAGVSDEATNFISKSAASMGDEILSPYFKRADATKPVNLYPLANYSGRSTFAKGAFGFNSLGSTAAANSGYYLPGGSDSFGGQNQKLLPGIANGNTTSWSTPSSVYGFRHSEYPLFSDDALTANGIHNVRIYPAKNQAGVQIPNTYIVAEDLGTEDCCFKNFDYQDTVFLLTNSVPESQTVAGPLPGNSALNLDFSAAKAGTVLDKDGTGTGFAQVQANTAGNQYTASQIDINTTTGRLQLTSAAGTNSSGTNTQRNALETPFNASAGNFRIATRMIGPFSFLNVANEQQAVYFGPDQNNHLKAEVEYQASGVQITIWREQNGVGAVVGSAVIPNLVNATTLDFFMDGNVSAKTFNVLVSVNGAAATTINTSPITVPNNWFGVSVPAGILVSHQGGSQFVATYDSFTVTARP